MARIARSKDPLYITQGMSFSFPARMESPSGVAIDLRDSSIAGELKWAGVRRALSIEMVDSEHGRLRFYGDESASAGLPLGRFAEIVLTHTDSRGNLFRYVYPVIGEVP